MSNNEQASDFCPLKNLLPCKGKPYGSLLNKTIYVLTVKGRAYVDEAL